MKRSRFLILAVPFLVAVSACHKTPDPVKPTDVSAWKGLVFNEIAAHDQTKDAETWVELVNTTSATMDLSGLGLYITDAYFKGQRIWQAASGAKLAAGERLVLSTADESLVTGISSADQLLLKLAVEDGTAVDEFDRSKAFAEPAAAFPRGSYQRIPDGTGDWKNMTYNSIGKENKVFSLADYKHTAVWAWSSHISDMIADDFAKLKNLKKLGYDHILMNYAGFEKKNLRQQAIRFIRLADEIGLVVHVWLQCFYDGGWISPIDDDKKAYKEEVFERIRNAREDIEKNDGKIYECLDVLCHNDECLSRGWPDQCLPLSWLQRNVLVYLPVRYTEPKKATSSDSAAATPAGGRLSSIAAWASAGALGAVEALSCPPC